MSILTVEQEQPHGHVAGQAIGGFPGALLYGARDSWGHAGEANNLFTWERESIEETDALKEGDHEKYSVLRVPTHLPIIEAMLTKPAYFSPEHFLTS